jgi:rubredoxin
MLITCECGHEYRAREVPCPDGIEGCLVFHRNESSYICPKCEKNNLPDLSQGVTEEIGRGVVNIGGIMGLDIIDDMSPICVAREMSWEDTKRAVERVKEIARETNQPIVINCGGQEPLLVNEPADRTEQEEE